MTIYLVWDGYEDIAGVFLKEENAHAFCTKLKEENPHRADWAFSVTGHVVEDSP